MSEVIKSEKLKPGEKLSEPVKKALLKAVEEKLFTSGFNWNKSELGREFGTTVFTVTNCIEEITNRAKYVNYEAMQIIRLEKNRQLLLEELNSLRTKDKPRSHILRELRDTEREISEQRRKSGMSENKETENINLTSDIKVNVNIPKEVLELMKNGIN